MDPIIIKRGGGAQTLKVRVAEFAWLKVENVLQKQIYVIDLYCYMIKRQCKCYISVG
jgi:hypothetical protein